VEHHRQRGRAIRHAPTPTLPAKPNPGALNQPVGGSRLSRPASACLTPRCFFLDGFEDADVVGDADPAHPGSRSGPA
jgi:hypothetical protein